VFDEIQTTMLYPQILEAKILGMQIPCSPVCLHCWDELLHMNNLSVAVTGFEESPNPRKSGK
jgi:hypothetical protein